MKVIPLQFSINGLILTLETLKFKIDIQILCNIPMENFVLLHFIESFLPHFYLQEYFILF